MRTAQSVMVLEQTFERVDHSKKMPLLSAKALRRSLRLLREPIQNTFKNLGCSLACHFV